MITNTEARVRKLFARNPGMSVEQIARKIGRPDEAGKARVAAILETIPEFQAQVAASEEIAAELASEATPSPLSGLAMVIKP